MVRLPKVYISASSVREHGNTDLSTWSTAIIEEASALYRNLKKHDACRRSSCTWRYRCLCKPSPSAITTRKVQRAAVLVDLISVVSPPYSAKAFSGESTRRVPDATMDRERISSISIATCKHLIFTPCRLAPGRSHSKTAPH